MCHSVADIKIRPQTWTNCKREIIMLHLRGVSLFPNEADGIPAGSIFPHQMAAKTGWTFATDVKNGNAGPLLRDFPYYATFREKGAKLACADKLGVFLSLTLCKKASFEYLAFIK